MERLIDLGKFERELEGLKVAREAKKSKSADFEARIAKISEEFEEATKKLSEAHSAREQAERTGDKAAWSKAMDEIAGLRSNIHEKAGELKSLSVEIKGQNSLAEATEPAKNLISEIESCFAEIQKISQMAGRELDVQKHFFTVFHQQGQRADEIEKKIENWLSK